MSQAMSEETYLPEDQDSLAKVFNFLETHAQVRGTTPAPRYLLVGADLNDQVELPEELHRVLLQVVEALQAGLAVNVAPKSTQLTTQQAADLLGISRPTLIALLDDNKIPHTMVGTHRRMMLDDVLTYRESRKEAQYAALAALYDDEPAVQMSDGSERLKRARAKTAERRRRQER